MVVVKQLFCCGLNKLNWKTEKYNRYVAIYIISNTHWNVQKGKYKLINVEIAIMYSHFEQNEEKIVNTLPYQLAFQSWEYVENVFQKIFKH